MAIRFYSRTDEFGDFCNFSSHGFELDGKYWLTVEHYFQAQKFAGTAREETIRRARTPADAKSLGNSRAFPIRADWEDVKDGIMLRAVARKFETHRHLRERLLRTQDEELIENSPADFYWGCGNDGTGQNRLGQILMEVRARLRGHDAGSAPGAA